MNVNISFIKLKNNVTSEYHLTKRNWKSKEVQWSDIHKVMSNSKIQYSCYSWLNGYKTYDNWSNDKQSCVVLDIDDGMTISQFQKQYKHLTYCLATTKSNMIMKKGLVLERFRVLLPCINVSTNPNIYFKALELVCDANDTQTLTRTASFLGNDNAIIIYNDAKVLDMYPYNELAELQLQEEETNKLIIDQDLLPNVSRLNVSTIKENLTFEVVVEVIRSLGYEVNGSKFRLRSDERTDSATINYRSLNIKDYGDGYSNDLIGLLVDKHGFSFKEALSYINNYI